VNLQHWLLIKLYHLRMPFISYPKELLLVRRFAKIKKQQWELLLVYPIGMLKKGLKKYKVKQANLCILQITMDLARLLLQDLKKECESHVNSLKQKEQNVQSPYQ